MTIGRKASRRFAREKDGSTPPPSIILTDDDLAILWHVYRHRLLDSESIYRLFPERSEQQLSRLRISQISGGDFTRSWARVSRHCGQPLRGSGRVWPTVA
jgi:hypothetical protein